jgi:hypothetical protein
LYDRIIATCPPFSTVNGLSIDILFSFRQTSKHRFWQLDFTSEETFVFNWIDSETIISIKFKTIISFVRLLQLQKHMALPTIIKFLFCKNTVPILLIAFRIFHPISVLYKLTFHFFFCHFKTFQL